MNKQYPSIFHQFAEDTSVGENGYSTKTVEGYLKHLEQFIQFVKRAKENKKAKDLSLIDITNISIDDLKQITNDDLKKYMKYCGTEENKGGRGNSANTVCNKLSAIETFWNYLISEEKFEVNIVKGIKRPKIKKKPMECLSLHEAKLLLETIKNSDKEFKIRDYAIFTIFMNCANRLSELTNMNIRDLDLKNTRIKVNGKGNKDRYLMLNPACINAITQYLEVRKELVKRACMDKKDKDALFISKQGKRVSNSTVQNLLKDYAEIAGLDAKKIHVHELRHTAATLMYKHGHVDILRLQKVLGHESVATTQIYTHVDDDQVQEAVNNHPLANMI